MLHCTCCACLFVVTCEKQVRVSKWRRLIGRKVFIATPIDVDVFKFREIFRTGNRWDHASFTWSKNKTSHTSQTVATARIAPQTCQGQSPTMYSECSRFHPNRFTFGGTIVERVKTTKSVSKFNIRPKPSFEPNNNLWQLKYVTLLPLQHF